MRKHILVAMTVSLILALATVALAGDPIIGTWKLNIAKSKLPPTDALGTPAKEQTEVYREIEGDQIERTDKEFRTDGLSISEIMIYPRQGGSVKIMQGAFEGDSFVETVIEPGNWYVTCLRNGKQTAVVHKTFSKDGKTMRQTVKGFDPKGMPFEELLVFERK